MVKQYQLQKRLLNRYSASRISSLRFRVDSHKSHMSYVVTRTLKSNVWTCQCHDFVDRLRSGNDDKRCIHIRYVHEFLSMPHDEKPVKESKSEPTGCVYCSSTQIIKNGNRKTKRRGKLQIYRCKNCHKKFTDSEKGFARARFEPSMISEALNLIMSGMSLRNTAEHLSNSRNVKVSYGTLGSWVKKYSTMIKEYTDTLRPTVGNTWSIDEKMINVRKTEPIPKKGYYEWLWSAIDPKTRFLLATKISKKREKQNVIDILDDTMKYANIRPEYIITDSLRSYDGAIRKKFGYGNVAHVKTNSIRDGFTNLPIERYHNEISANLKTCRGLDNSDSSQIYADLLRIHHNFVRPHMGLDGKTPAVVAGLGNVDVSQKYQSLISAAASSRRRSASNVDLNVVLGDLIRQVEITCNNEFIQIAPKGWIDNIAWAEINTILLKFGFRWFFNNYLRCWLGFHIRLRYDAKMSLIVPKAKSAI